MQVFKFIVFWESALTLLHILGSLGLDLKPVSIFSKLVSWSFYDAITFMVMYPRIAVLFKSCFVSALPHSFFCEWKHLIVSLIPNSLLILKAREIKLQTTYWIFRKSECIRKYHIRERLNLSVHLLFWCFRLGLFLPNIFFKEDLTPCLTSDPHFWNSSIKIVGQFFLKSRLVVLTKLFL